MDYDDLLKLGNVENLFKTERGSTYAHHADATTTRNRSGAGHADKTEGMQPKSGKTVFMSPQDVNRLGGFFQNPDMATKFTPIFDEKGKPTGRASLTLLEDYGPRKAGSVLVDAPYQTRPAVGMNPVEIYRSESKIGDTGRGIHFGNKITEVRPVRGSGGGGGMGDVGIKGIGRKSKLDYATGGGVKMPQEYSQGSWKLI
jgi:hypothetical protein